MVDEPQGRSRAHSPREDNAVPGLKGAPALSLDGNFVASSAMRRRVFRTSIFETSRNTTSFTRERTKGAVTTILFRSASSARRVSARFALNYSWSKSIDNGTTAGAGFEYYQIDNPTQTPASFRRANTGSHRLARSRKACPGGIPPVSLSVRTADGFSTQTLRASKLI